MCRREVKGCKTMMEWEVEGRDPWEQVKVVVECVHTYIDTYVRMYVHTFVSIYHHTAQCICNTILYYGPIH